MLCHSVLPYSNWQWATPCHSESFEALRQGLQNALFRLGKVPDYHQTDNSTAATHRVGSKREFNENYEALIRRLGMIARTIGIGEKEQNGDVESLNGSLKRRLEQQLLLRGSRDFEHREAYEKWLHQMLGRANQGRRKRVKEDLDAMRPLSVDRLLDYDEETVRVTSWSTIRIKRNSYSVPSRLIGEHVRVRIYCDRLEVMHGGRLQVTLERLSGHDGHRIDYRHVIHSLIKKPGALTRYRFKKDLFPTLQFRRAYDRLHETLCERSADLEYLRILYLAATTLESDVNAAVELLLDSAERPDCERVKRVLSLHQEPEVPEIDLPPFDFSDYDQLLASEVS